MKSTREALKYPVITQLVAQGALNPSISFAIVTPDFNLSPIHIPPPLSRADLEKERALAKSKGVEYKDYVSKMKSSFSDEEALRVGHALLKMYDEIRKNFPDYNPTPSAAKELFEKSKTNLVKIKTLSVPQFAKLVNEQIRVSEDTIQRDLDRQIIEHTRTVGGNKRRGRVAIPQTEIKNYVSFLSKKGSGDSDERLAQNLRLHRVFNQELQKAVFSYKK